MSDIEAIVAALRSDQCLSKTLNDGTGVVVDLESSRVLALNVTGMFLLQELSKGTDSLDVLVEALSREFDVDHVTAEGDIRELLESLRKHLE